MRKPSRSGRKPRLVIDGHDEIEVASIDSFPASDPPGWIEATAHPFVDNASSSGEERLERRAETRQRAGAQPAAGDLGRST